MVENKIRVPGRLEVSTKFFGQFTAKDLVRLTSPVLVVYLFNASNVFLVVAALFAVVWYRFTVYGQHLDGLLFNLVRWYLGVRQLDDKGIDSLEEDVVFVDSRTAVAAIEVSPVNLEMRSESEQAALHSIYQNLLDTVNYPVSIYSRQEELGLEGYVERLKTRDAPREKLGEEHVEFCEDLSKEQLTSTNHIIILRVETAPRNWLLDIIDRGNSENSDALRNELDSRCREVLDVVNTGELKADRLTGTDLTGVSPDFSHHTKPGLTLTNTHRYCSDYQKTLYISEFPATVRIGWVLQLLRTSGRVDITQVIQPRDSGKTTKTLQRLSEKLNAEINSFLSQGYRGTNKLEGLLRDTEWFLDLLADRQASPVDYGVYITVHGYSKEKCLQNYREVCNRLQTQQVSYQETVLRTDQARTSNNPLRRDALNETQLVPSNSAAAGFPFGTQTTQNEDGVIHGVDTKDKTPVLVDRFSWSSHSTARMGMVGSGKSYAAKIELLRSAHVYEDLQIIIVDPKKEYDWIVKALNGSVQTIEPGANYEFKDRVTGFQVEERGQQRNTELLADLVQQIYSATSQNTEKTLVLVDEARILMNDETGRQVLNQFVLEARDTNTAITLVSQNASHFTYCREGREILDNMPGKVFMRHDRVPESVVDYFELSQREKQELYELKTGTESTYSEAILKINNRLDTRIKIRSTPIEHSVIQARGEI